MPTLTVVAGPNGSGKSTFAQAMKLKTIDPDRLAAGYGQGFTPEANLRASREALEIMQDRLAGRQSFAIETTLAGRQPLRLMDQAVEAGYRVHLAFIVPNDQEDTRLRIENRVMRGGHNIPDADLERRGPRILANLPDAIERTNLTALYVSSVQTRDFTLVGAAYRGEIELTPAVPRGVRTAIADHFEVRDVETINQRHPVVEQFQARVQRDWGF